MALILQVLLLKVIYILSLVFITLSNVLPFNPCPNYLQYENYGNKFFGKLTLGNITNKIGTITLVEVNLKQNYLELCGSCGISFLDNEQATEEGIIFNKRVSLKLQFPNKVNISTITSIKLNRINEICVYKDRRKHKIKIKMLFAFVRTNTSIEQIKNIYNKGNLIRDGCSFLDTSQSSKQEFNYVFNTSKITNVSLNNFFKKNCGIETEKLEISPLIRGGSIISPGQFPWLTAIYKKQFSDLSYICCGSLISSRTIVTAAHCIKKDNLEAKNVVVFLGRHNLEIYNNRDYIVRDVEKFLVHFDFKKAAISDADIALLYLEMSVEFNEFIKPICLWNESNDIRNIVGEKAVIAGWGSLGSGKDVSAFPRSASATIVSESDCLRSSQIFRNITSSRTICAGNKDDTGPCMGDSGSGLILKRKGRWTLRGIVSIGLTDQARCNLNEYVVYCDVSQYMSWIFTNLII